MDCNSWFTQSNSLLKLILEDSWLSATTIHAMTFQKWATTSWNSCTLVLRQFWDPSSFILRQMKTLIVCVSKNIVGTVIIVDSHWNLFNTQWFIHTHNLCMKDLTQSQLWNCMVFCSRGFISQKSGVLIWINLSSND